jgi:hypothetical protein
MKVSRPNINLVIARVKIKLIKSENEVAVTTETGIRMNTKSITAIPVKVTSAARIMSLLMDSDESSST